MGRRASYREGLSFGALSFVLIGVLGVASAVLTARIYGVHVIGEYALAVAPMNAVFFLSTVRERPALLRELARLEPRAPRVTGLFVAVFTFSFLLTAVVATLGSVAMYFIFAGPLHAPSLFLPALVAVGGYLFVINTNFNFDTVFAGFRGGRQLFWIRLHEQVAFTIIAVAAGLLWGTVWGLVAATVGSTFTALLHRVLSIRGLMRFVISGGEIRSGFATLGEIIKFGLKSAPGAIADGISNESATWMLGLLGNVNAVGAYNRAWVLARRFMDLSFRMNEMLFPTLVERRAKGDSAGFDRALIDSVRYAAVAMLLPASAAGGAAYGIMSLFGAGFSQTADALAIILLMPALATISNFLRHTLYAMNEPVRGSLSGGIRMVLTVAATVPLVLVLGVTGAALAVVLGFVADLSYSSIVARRALGAPVRHLWPGRQVVALLLAYASGFVAARVTTNAFDQPISLLVALPLGGACYVAVFWAAGGIDQRDRRRLDEIRTMLRGRRGAPSQAGV